MPESAQIGSKDLAHIHASSQAECRLLTHRFKPTKMIASLECIKAIAMAGDHLMRACIVFGIMLGGLVVRSPQNPIQRTPKGALGLVVWIIAIQCLLTEAARADLRILKRTGGSIELLISGTITERDAEAIEALAPELERSFLEVRLDSTGGDVDAAMKIGRVVRKYEGFTSIDKEPSQRFVPNANCYSSCALIFIAGVHRSIISDGGQLGLHRPYLASAPQSRQAVEKQVPLMLSQVRQYVTEMGITDIFYQQMVNTDPSKMVVYGNLRAAEFRELDKELGIRNTLNDWTRLVSEHDTLNQEITTAYAARQYGVTTLEMRKRDNDAEQCFKKKGGDYFACTEAIRWGLSERVYLERSKQAQTVCSRDEDQKFLLTIPKKERRDHPVWIKRETCTREIMLGRS